MYYREHFPIVEYFSVVSMRGVVVAVAVKNHSEQAVQKEKSISSSSFLFSEMIGVPKFSFKGGREFIQGQSW